MLKFFKWFFAYILLLLIIGIIVGTFYFKYNLKPKIQPLVQKEISNKLQDSAVFSYEDLSINFLNKSANITNIKFSLVDKEKPEDTIARLTLDEISFQIGNSYFDFTSLDSLSIKYLNLKNPEAFLPMDTEKIRIKDSKEKTEKQIILFLKSINLNEGNIALYDKPNEKVGLLTTGIKIDCDSLLIDENFSLENFSPASFGASLFNVDYRLKDDFHRAKIELVNINFSKGGIGLKNAVFEPIYSKKRFAERKGVEKTYLKIKADSLTVSDWKWKELEGVFAEEITLVGGNLYAHKDKNYELPDDRFVPILTEELRKSDIPIYIKKVKVEDSFIGYEQLSKGKEKTGKLHFDNVEGEITNISNVKDSIKNTGNSLTIEASGNFYGKGKLETTMNYSLESSAFQIEGSLSEMEIAPINNFIQNIYPVKVKSGKTDKVEFDFSGDNIKSKGELRFYYSGLKLESEIKDEEGKLLDKAVTKVGNWVLAQNNPKSEEDEMEIGRFEHERDTRKSMFNFWAKSVVAGFKATFGIDEIEETKERMEDEDKNFWEKLGFGNDD
ncbi:hypothetical protein ABWH96_00320 [Marivirga tractuosa]|uniref:hypothetical protein n=1 Tax=Marivirga tractuosa TaxID=1006 RepID=UPI0035D0139C